MDVQRSSVSTPQHTLQLASPSSLLPATECCSRRMAGKVAMMWVSACLLLLAAVFQGAGASAPRLKVGYYNHSCYGAESIVNKAVVDALTKTPGLGAGLIRMAFHDCFVQGCDASVLLDPTPANPQPEKLSPPNFPSLRGFEVVDAAKAALEKVCPGVVSCADVLAFAARDAAVFLSGGKIKYALPSGRFDGFVSLDTEALQFLPPPFFSLSELIESFKVKKMNVDDLVVLSGAHSIGISHCSSFLDRLPPNPSNMNPKLKAAMQQRCPVPPTINSDPVAVLDLVTPGQLDNQYYKNVLKHNVLFRSDDELLKTFLTRMLVRQNALHPEVWERKFAKAMIKMSAIEIKTAANGEIRKNCRVINSRKY